MRLRGPAVRRGLLIAGYLALAAVFGGVLGLIVGAAVVAAWLGLRLSSGNLWLGAVVAMAGAPFAVMAQGLPDGPVLGPGFGERHWVAHLLVGISLALAALAGLSELGGIPSRTGPAEPVPPEPVSPEPVSPEPKSRRLRPARPRPGQGTPTLPFD